MIESGYMKVTRCAQRYSLKMCMKVKICEIKNDWDDIITSNHDAHVRSSCFGCMLEFGVR